MNRGPLLNSSLAVSRSLTGCFVTQNIGEMRSVATRRGVKNTYNGSNRGGLEYKQEPPIPPLSGGEVARKTEEKGRGLSERSEFRRPRLRRQTQKPNNRGGTSWFVLLAAEKNEQIKRINVTRTFFDRERKSLVFNLLPLPCPVCGGIALQ